MGLDMYAYARKGKLPAPCDFDQDETDERLHYWRKHPDLHGWMFDLYMEKGGNSLQFNCDTVELTAADLDRLEEAITGQKLPNTQGFFFGESSADDAADDLAFVKKAREAIGAGKAVYYTSWW